MFLGTVTKTSQSTKQTSHHAGEGSSCPIQLALPWMAIPPLYHSPLQPFYPKGSFIVSVSVISHLVWFIWIDANSLKPCTLCLDGFYKSYLPCCSLGVILVVSCLRRGRGVCFRLNLLIIASPEMFGTQNFFIQTEVQFCCEIYEYRWKYLVLFYTCKFLYSNLCTTMFANFWHSKGFQLPLMIKMDD